MGPRMVNLSECMDPKRFVYHLLDFCSFLLLGLSHTNLKCEDYLSVSSEYTVRHILPNSFPKNIPCICITQSLDGPGGGTDLIREECMASSRSVYSL